VSLETLKTNWEPILREKSDFPDWQERLREFVDELLKEVDNQ
jgi:hypothetical protein